MASELDSALCETALLVVRSNTDMQERLFNYGFNLLLKIGYRGHEWLASTQSLLGHSIWRRELPTSRG
jgi:hypothetical protein